uniref:Uncharacterized protein n=1 Tax=Leersia perrieri TaxID=77586 RepID=A0A0D9WN06_9ORYZ
MEKQSLDFGKVLSEIQESLGKLAGSQVETKTIMSKLDQTVASWKPQMETVVKGLRQDMEGLKKQVLSLEQGRSEVGNSLNTLTASVAKVVENAEKGAPLLPTPPMASTSTSNPAVAPRELAMEVVREASFARGHGGHMPAGGGGPAVTPWECARECREMGFGRGKATVSACGPAVTPPEYAMEGCGEEMFGRGRGINTTTWAGGPAVTPLEYAMEGFREVDMGRGRGFFNSSAQNFGKNPTHPSPTFHQRQGYGRIVIIVRMRDFVY